MRDVIFEASSPPVTSADVDQTEKTLGFKFPSEVREFYLSHNGGSPDPHLFKKDEDFYAIHQFFPIRYGTSNERLEDIYLDCHALDTFPGFLVPIATDPGGDYFCFSLREHESGAIYCYIQDYYDDPDRSNVYLAANLLDFLQGLTEDTVNT